MNVWYSEFVTNSMTADNLVKVFYMNTYRNSLTFSHFILILLLLNISLFNFHVFPGDPIQERVDALLWVACEGWMDATLPGHSEKLCEAVQPCTTDENSWKTDRRGERAHLCVCGCAPRWWEVLTHISVVLHHTVCLCAFFFLQMLAVDLSIWISGVDQMDSVDLTGIETDSVSKWESTADLISQWEAELLQEKLQELLHAADDDHDDAKTQVWRMNMTVYQLCITELHIIYTKKDIPLTVQIAVSYAGHWTVKDPG